MGSICIDLLKQLMWCTPVSIAVRGWEAASQVLQLRRWETPLARRPATFCILLSFTEKMLKLILVRLRLISYYYFYCSARPWCNCTIDHIVYLSGFQSGEPKKIEMDKKTMESININCIVRLSSLRTIYFKNTLHGTVFVWRGIYEGDLVLKVAHIAHSG